MLLLIIGLALLVARAAEFGPFATLSWWIVAAPFAGAVLWWHFADSSGLTTKREMIKMDKRKAERREKAMSALGLDPRRDRQAHQVRQNAERKLGESADPTQAQFPTDPTRRDQQP
jgi:small Trp-rich protein